MKSNDWSVVIDHLVRKIFDAALSADPKLAESLARFDGCLELDPSGGMSFTLPDLYRFVMSDLKLPPTAGGYLQFRRALYGSHVNAGLVTIGAVVVVGNASTDPALRRYQLKRLST